PRVQPISGLDRVSPGSDHSRTGRAICMSVNPDHSPGPAGDAQAQLGEQAEPEKVRRSWPARLLNICFAILALEIGIFLVIFPWMDDVWKVNYFQAAVPALRNIWEDPYF